MTRFSTKLVLAALIALPTVPAVAETKAIVVNYGDLDLVSTAGRATLKHRLAAAASEVCGSPSHGQLDTYRACEDQVLSHARADMAQAASRAPVVALR